MCWTVFFKVVHNGCVYGTLLTRKLNRINTKNEKQCAIHDVSNSAVRPPLGLVPKWVRQKERYYEVCGAIARYYDAGKKISIEWVEEYNELVEHCC